MNRNDAWNLLTQYNDDPFHLQHAQVMERGVTSTISAMVSLSYPLRINSPPCSRFRACGDKLPCFVLISVLRTKKQFVEKNLEKFLCQGSKRLAAHN